MSKSTSTRSPDRLALERAAEHAFAWLEGLDTRHVGATATVAQMRARLARPLADAGVDAAGVSSAGSSAAASRPPWPQTG